MNNDELQKAIDDITKDNNTPVAPVTDAAAENEQLADELTGQIAAPVAPVEPAEPVEPVAPEVDLGTAPAPEIPDVPGMPPVDEPEAVAKEPAEPVAPAPVEAAAPVAEPEVVASVEPVKDEATLNEALKELCPLLDKVELPVKEKFDITMKVGEPAKALDYAKQIQDEGEKANALLEIVNKLK